MERAGAPLLSFGHPAEGAPPVPMEQSLAKRPRPPKEAEQVSAIRDPRRTTRPVAPATPPTAAMLVPLIGDSWL